MEISCKKKATQGLQNLVIIIFFSLNKNLHEETVMQLYLNLFLLPMHPWMNFQHFYFFTVFSQEHEQKDVRCEADGK